MSRVDVRINLSFKNNQYELDLYNFVMSKGELIGTSAYLKTLIAKAMEEEKQNKE